MRLEEGSRMAHFSPQQVEFRPILQPEVKRRIPFNAGASAHQVAPERTFSEQVGALVARVGRLLIAINGPLAAGLRAVRSVVDGEGVILIAMGLQ